LGGPDHARHFSHASGAGGSDLPHRICPIAKVLLLDCRSIICDQFNNRRIYRSLRLLATLHRISDSERGNRRETQGHADAAYDKLMKEADTYGQPIDS
jgi:hypothetical protein